MMESNIKPNFSFLDLVTAVCLTPYSLLSLHSFPSVPTILILVAKSCLLYFFGIVYFCPYYYQTQYTK